MKPLEHFLWIGSVEIVKGFDGGYVAFISDLDICNDGRGPSHGAPRYQSQTAYYSGGKQGGTYLNADVDQYIVIPPQIRSGVPPAVMGCQGRMNNMKTGKWRPAVVGASGPDNKTGEAAYCLAKKANEAITHNAGDSTIRYLYELWP